MRLRFHPQIQFAGRLSKHFLGAVARETRKPFIHFQVSAVGETPQSDGIWTRVHHLRVFLFGLTQQRLRFLPVGNVAHDPCENAPLSVNMLPQGNFNREFRSIAAQPCQFDCRPRDMLLPCLQVPPDGSSVHLSKVIGHQHRHLAAHHFGIRVSENPFGRFVDKENYAFFVYGDDSVRGCLGDDAEELCALNGILAGINWSCALGVPWSRHSRLITWSLSPQTLRIGAVRTKGFQPLAAMDTNECSIRT